MPICLDAFQRMLRVDYTTKERVISNYQYSSLQPREVHEAKTAIFKRSRCETTPFQSDKSGIYLPHEILTYSTY
ncbi:hypothetical protein LAY57_13630 [Argonema antarcticum A004/B2]|nr:hypothetical protein [Argonema antarcticum A004/B2]